MNFPINAAFEKVNSLVLMQNSRFYGIAQKLMFEVYEKCHENSKLFNVQLQ